MLSASAANLLLRTKIQIAEVTPGPPCWVPSFLKSWLVIKEACKSSQGCVHLHTYGQGTGTECQAARLRPLGRLLARQIECHSTADCGSCGCVKVSCPVMPVDAMCRPPDQIRSDQIRHWTGQGTYTLTAICILSKCSACANAFHPLDKGILPRPMDGIYHLPRRLSLKRLLRRVCVRQVHMRHGWSWRPHLR